MSDEEMKFEPEAHEVKDEPAPTVVVEPTGHGEAAQRAVNGGKRL